MPWDGSELVLVLRSQSRRICLHCPGNLKNVQEVQDLALRPQQAWFPAWSQGGSRTLPSTDRASPNSQLCPEVSLSPNSLQDGKEYLFQAKDEVSCPLSSHIPRAPLPFLEPSSCSFPFLPLRSFSLSVSFYKKQTAHHLPAGCL